MGNSSSNQTQTSSSQSPSNDRRGEVTPAALSVRPPRQDSSGAKPRDSEPAVTTVDKKTLSPKEQAIENKLEELNYEEQIQETKKSMAKNLKEFNENTKGLLDFRDQLMGIGILPSELQASLNSLKSTCRVAEDINEELKIFSNIANDLFDRDKKVKSGSLEIEELKLEESEMLSLQKKLVLYQSKLNMGLQTLKESVNTFENCFERAVGSLDRIKEDLQSDKKKYIAKGCLVAAGLLLGGVLVVGAAIFVLKQGSMALMKGGLTAMTSETKRCGKLLFSSMSNATEGYRDAQAQLKSIREYQELLVQPDSLNFETENLSEMIKRVRTDANTCCEQVLESIQKEEQLIQLVQEKEQWTQDKEQTIRAQQQQEEQIIQMKQQIIQMKQQQEEQIIQMKQQQEEQTIQMSQKNEQLIAEIARLKQEKEQTVQTQQQLEEQTVQSQYVEVGK